MTPILLPEAQRFLHTSAITLRKMSAGRSLAGAPSSWHQAQRETLPGKARAYQLAVTALPRHPQASPCSVTLRALIASFPLRRNAGSFCLLRSKPRAEHWWWEPRAGAFQQLHAWSGARSCGDCSMASRHSQPDPHGLRRNQRERATKRGARSSPPSSFIRMLCLLLKFHRGGLCIFSCWQQAEVLRTNACGEQERHFTGTTS